jgi:glycosyltransferase involved in cell wall biosynthesis
VASEHIGPEHYRRRHLEWLLLQAMPLLAVKITVVSQQIMGSFNAWLRRKMVVAHNPVSFSATPRTARHGSGKEGAKVLLTVGRMTEQKNQACLVEAFGRIADDFPEWTLRIAGQHFRYRR